jgi:hypothetical protein
MPCRQCSHCAEIKPLGSYRSDTDSVCEDCRIKEENKQLPDAEIYPLFFDQNFFKNKPIYGQMPANEEQ